jgi:hypothetical protein
VSDQAKQIEARTKARAEEVKGQLLECSSDLGKRNWKIGLLAAEAHDNRLFEVLGYESEQDFRISVKIGRSTYFRDRRLAMEIGRPLLQKELLTRSRLDRLTLENADQLLRLDARRRFSESWVEKAMTMTEEQFEAEVDRVVLNGDETETTITDPASLIKIRCTESQKAVILAEFREIAAEHGIEVDDLGGILEAGMADWHNWHQTEVEEREAAEAVGA